jgi:hypothetical protein
MGAARKVFVHSGVAERTGSLWWPVDIESRSRTRSALRNALGSAGASAGKNLSTGSSMLSSPSDTARPTAVDVKLLVSEYIVCRTSGA